MFGLGTHIKTTEDSLLMFGASYITSAVSDADRTPDLPVDEQVRLAAGYERRTGESWTIGLNYTLAWLGNNKVDQSQPLPGRIVGAYDAYAHLIGIYTAFSF